jgi:ribosomal protein S18 acetylase RimI-like enzyme
MAASISRTINSPNVIFVVLVFTGIPPLLPESSASGIPDILSQISGLVGSFLIIFANGRQSSLIRAKDVFLSGRFPGRFSELSKAWFRFCTSSKRERTEQRWAMRKLAKHPLEKVTVREMCVDDIPDVYRLAQRLFRSQKASTFYRTWDAFEVTNNFNQDPHLTLVAESRTKAVVGFALGTTYENESRGWKYGYILWMGVSPRLQGTGLGRRLYHEMERRMHAEGVRMAFVDTARSNTGAIKFFKRMGYGKPEAEVWMSKVLQGKRKSKETEKFVRKHRATARAA